jgi:hypothetical protein
MRIGGYSPSRLDRMHEEMAGYAERGELPGLVYLISRRGEVHVDTIGTMSLGGKEFRGARSLRLLLDGPAKGTTTIALDHGAGSAMDSPFMEFFAKGRETAAATAPRRRPFERRHAIRRIPLVLPPFSTIRAGSGGAAGSVL